MNKLMTSALALSLVAGTAWAESHSGMTENGTLMDEAQAEATQMANDAEQAAEETGAAVSQMAQDAGQALENAGETATQMAQDAGNAAEEAIEGDTEVAVEGTATAEAEATQMASAEATFTNGGLIRTRDITGGEIYTTNAAQDEGSWAEADYTEVNADWNDIGEIEDIVLDSSGKMIGVVAEVGGFLDIGDKHVLLRLEDVKLVPVDDKSYAVVTNMSEEQLEELQSVDEAVWN